jgi:hypothetical protein
MLPVIVGLLGIAYPTLFALMTRGPARWRAKSRVDVIVEGLTASLMVVLVHEVFAWWVVPVALWLIPVAILAWGIFGAVMEWPKLPWLRAGRSLARTVITAALNVLVIAVILIVVFA